MALMIIGGRARHYKPIEEALISACGKANPKVLYLPTAGGDDLRNYTLFEADMAKYGGRVQALLLHSDPPKSLVVEALNHADIIYLGGGNVGVLMSTLKRYGLDQILKSLIEDKIVAGISAGGLCFGVSYFNHTEDVPCIAYFPYKICPHYNREAYQKSVDLFKSRLQGQVAYALEDDSAIIIDKDIQIIGNVYRIDGVHEEKVDHIEWPTMTQDLHSF